ncbi:MAG TPA: BamA/TamA family outer membrane protein [Nitrospirota bacterium]|nr:BamA/TamA family outer membrane protein [Nitrospirota bacterium]
MSLWVFACTTMVPRKKLPDPLTNDTFGDQVKVVTVPLPVIASSPNEGVTFGALVAFLLHNEKDEVSTLLAPQVNYNRYFGVSTSLYGAFYPSPVRNWEFTISKSTRVNEDYEFGYADRSLFNGKAEGRSFLYIFTDGSARFFGFGSNSLQANETNFGDKESGITLSLAYGIAENLRLVVGDRFRRVDIVQGAVTSVPFIGDKFSTAEVPGINGFTVHAQKLGLVYSTLDLPALPTAGLYAEASVEESAKALGSSTDFVHYQAEVKGYAPSGNARWISVFRIAYNRTPGGDVPFLERSILGGETTLRGYGRYRFIDSTSLLFNLEERITVFRWKVFNVMTDWEMAPFVDYGGVMESLGAARRDDFKINPGIGFRAVVRPNIVGRVDIGFGNEGAAVFVGLGYPF